MKGRVGFLSWLVLLALLLAPSPARILAGSVPEAVFHEDFTTYQHLDESRRVDWDPFRGYARLLLNSAADIDPGNPNKLPDGSVLAPWVSKFGKHSILYLQHFDARGNPLWPEDCIVYEKDGYNGMYSRDLELGLDGQGNIFILFWIEEDDYAHAYLQKLDREGHRIWASPLSLPLASEGWSAFVVGVDGSFYLADSGQGLQVRALRFSSSGDLQWDVVMSINGGIAEALGIDAAGNLLIAWSNDYGNSPGIIMQRLSPSGELLWPAPVQVSADNTRRDFYSTNLAVRQDASTYVAWLEREGEVGRITLQRISVDGTRLWPADVQVNGPSQAYWFLFGLALTPAGDALLWWQGKPAENAYLRRVTADGKLPEPEEAMPYDDPGIKAVNGSRQASEVRILEGTFLGRGWLWSYEADGSLVNVEPRRIYRGSGPATQRAASIVAGPGGTAQVAWIDSRRSTLDTVLQRFDPSGQPLNSIDVHLYREPVDYPYNMEEYRQPVIAGDAQGNLVTAWMTPNDAQDAWTLQVMKILPNGTAAWDETTRLTTLASWRRPAVAVDTQGYIYVAWSTFTEDVHNVLQVQKLSPQGKVLWAAPVNPKVSPPREGADWESQDWPILDACDDGTVLVAWQHAEFFEIDDMNEAGVDGRMQRLSSQGKPMWSADVIAGGIGGGSEPDLLVNRFNFAAASVDTGGGAYLAWVTSQDIVGWRLQVMRYGRDGQATWAQPLDVEEGLWDEGETPANIVQLSGLGESAVISWQGWNRSKALDSGYAARVGPEFVETWQRKVVQVPSTIWSSIDLELTSAGLSDGAVLVAYTVDQPVTGKDVSMIRLDETGDITPGWESPKSVVRPDYFFVSSGWVTSDTVAHVDSPITSATLTANFDLNEGTLRFQLSADGGAHWETVEPGQAHTFAYPGKRLRWRADFKPGRNFSASPVVYDLTIQYGEPLPPQVLDQQLWLPAIYR